MDSKYARAIGALNTAAKLAKNQDTKDHAVEFMKQNPSYFPKTAHFKLAQNSNPSVPKFVPLNDKNKKA